MSVLGENMLPLVSFLPLVNAQHAVCAILPQTSTEDGAQVLKLCLHLQASGSLAKLQAIRLCLPMHTLSLQDFPVSLIEDSNFIFSVPRSRLQDDSAALQVFERQLQDFALRSYAANATRTLENPKRLVSDELFSGRSQAAKLSAVNQLPVTPTWLTMASNLPDMTHFYLARERGFDLFSGDFAFDAKQGVHSRDLRTQTLLLQLLKLVARDAETKELELVFKQDANLSFMLLKMVRTAAFARAVKVASYTQAISMLGRRQLQRWLQMLLYAGAETAGVAHHPLMLRAAFRAAMMEGLMKKLEQDCQQQDGAFMVGMFSLLDLLFAMPMQEIIPSLNLPESLEQALLNRSGLMGACLNLVEQADRIHNRADLDVENLLNQAQCSSEDYYRLLMQAYAWVAQLGQI